MAGTIGRKIKLYWGDASPGEAIPGVRQKGFAFAGDPIDVTNDDDDGWRTLLDEPGERALNITLAGLVMSPLLKNAYMGTIEDRMQPVRIVYEDGGVLAGDFFLASYSEDAPYKEAVTFSAEIQSSGEFQWTPAS